MGRALEAVMAGGVQGFPSIVIAVRELDHYGDHPRTSGPQPALLCQG